MPLINDMLLELQENAKVLQRFVAPAAHDSRHGRDYRRKVWLEHYKHATQPRVPVATKVTPNTVLLLYMLGDTIRIQGVTGLPSGTKLLLAANCLPFFNFGGFSLPKFGLSPFMVWEHHQWYRLMTTGVLHVDFDHAVSNAANLVISASYLENSLPRSQFAALTASLGLTSHSLYVLLSWLDFRWFGMWRPYFQECAVGASGLCFALQVVADDMRGGRVSMMGISGLDIPSKFACWASLAMSQLLVPQASLTGHLCGVIAGLAHVYIPRAVREVRWRIEGKSDVEQPRSRQAAASRSDLEGPVEFAGRRWPDLAVHAACLCAALLTHIVLQKSRGKQGR